MKLTRKLTIALLLGLGAILLVNGWLRIHREIRLFERETIRDHHTMAHALSVSVAEVWRVEGEARALELLSRIDALEPQVRIRWVRPDAEPGSPLAPILAAGSRQTAEHNTVTDRSAVPGRVVTWMPVPGTPGAIEIEESLAAERAYVTATIRRFVGYTFLITAVSAAIAMSIGVMFVGRPVSRLIQQARRVGAGDLTQRVILPQRDELGELAREMNVMCDRLVEADDRAAAAMRERLAAIEQLRHADRLTTVGKLAAGVAHELGTPLNVVAGRAKMIASGEAAGEQVPENARIIADQADRIAQIVRQLLDFARRRTPRKERHDLREISERTAALLRPTAGARGVRLRTEGDARLAEVDAGQIQQALANLVINGVHATHNGGEIAVRTLLARARPPVDIGGDERECAVLEVADTGDGMPEDVRSHLFEPFFTTKQVGEGTGLGLSVTWGIVREHGGWIDVDSEPGKGSCFRIFLPLAESA